MPQVKKTEMRDAVLAAAFDLFSRKGYTATTLAEIARNAGTTSPNLYVYFESKLYIAYELYDPWLLREVESLTSTVLKLRSARQRLQRLFIGLWGDIPTADRHFANVLIEALASSTPETPKPKNLLSRIDGMLTELLTRIVPPERAHLVADGSFSRVVWMAFDGFTINQRIGQKADIESMAALMATLLLGED